MKTSPDLITSLGPNDIFVFGSNLAGIHGAGAALQAFEQFGAKWGVGYGFTGQCYAIPSKDKKIRTMPLTEIKSYVDMFIKDAWIEENFVFLVTPIGCGLAGYKPADIAPMFKDVPDNVHLPKSFIPYLQ